MFYAYDGLGSVAALSNHQGKLKARYQYDAFGEVLAGDLSDNPYAFTGQRLDPESNLYHFHFRKYDAEVGVWTTADPAGVVGGVNLYQYVNSNPVNMVDILGMFADDEGMDDLNANNESGDEGDASYEEIVTGPYCSLTPLDKGVYEIKDKEGNKIGWAFDYNDLEMQLGAIEPPVAAFSKALKLLKSYKRLAKKFNIRLSPKQVKKLDELKDSGQIKGTDLPAKIQKEFPQELKNKALSEIQKGCKK